MGRPPKWNDQANPAYWNRMLKEEGLATVKGRQVFDRKKWHRTGDARPGRGPQGSRAAVGGR